jgi:hypothetical protein
MENLKFILTEPLTVARKGEQEIVYELSLKGPTAKHRAYLIRLKKLFYNAITTVKSSNGGSAEVSDAGNSDEGLTGSQVMSLMYLSEANVLEFHDLMRELLLSPGTVVCGDGVSLTSHLYDSINLDDLENLLGEYFAGFLAPSLMKALKN